MGADDEVQVLGSETVFLHGGKKPSKVFEMASIDEDSDISPDDIAITIVLNGIFPRIREEILFYNHRFEISPPSIGKHPCSFASMLCGLLPEFPFAH